MKTIRVLVHTGSEDADALIIDKLQPLLGSSGVEFSELLYDVVITLPEYILRFNDTPALVLTDDMDIIQTHANALDYTPIPISEDDYLRIEFRLLGIIHTLRLIDES